MTAALRRAVFLLMTSALLLAASRTTAETNAAAILQELKNFRETGRVLYIAAHPDDEDTQLIAFLARARHYRTAYLSVTRGDGGQNVLGPEFGPELGVIRTQELLAARRLDGGEQFFTRALDFGYSKDYRETLRIWDGQKILADVVRVIRTFRPDVVIAGFSTNQTPGQHGHHVASAVLAGEAFKLAGDPNAFPDQLNYLKPWQPKRLLQNNRFGRRGGGDGDSSGPRVEISGNDPVLGISFNELAARSRAQHKSQGFGNFGSFGGGGPRTANFLVLAGEPATQDIMEGVDTSWARIPGGVAIGRESDDLIAQFDTNAPAASVNALLKLHKALATLPADDPAVELKRKQLDRILETCLGLSIETTTPNNEIVPGEKVALRSTAIVRSPVPVVWLGTAGRPASAIKLTRDQPASQDFSLSVPDNAEPSQPYWLQHDADVGAFQVDDAKLIGLPENPPAILVTNLFQVGGSDGPILAIESEPVLTGTESGAFEARRTVKIIPPVSLQLAGAVKLFAPGSTRQLSVEVTAARPGVQGELSLSAPAGWIISPEKRAFGFQAAGETRLLSFAVTAPAEPAIADLTAAAKIGGHTYNQQRVEIRYPHIPAQLLQPPARIRAVSLELAVRAKKVGYVPGAGDSVADALKEMGCEVTLLTGADLTTNRLKDFDAVVIGVRAFNVRTDLVPHLADLFAFVEGGGTVIEQYNRPGNDLKTDQLAPYQLRLSGDRVTDENAGMTFLQPEHPALNLPNKITPADFAGWVQERGIYFPNQWDEHFVPLLACNDPGESPLKGSLLVAPYGKGQFVYTSLVFFRELPAGVPGAYRLFANLVSLGK